MELLSVQKQAIELGRKIPNLALFWEPGVGKTAAIVRILCEEYNKQKRYLNTLIFAPISACPSWARQFSLWSEVDPSRVFVLNKAGAKRLHTLQAQMNSGKAFIAVTNYEAMLNKDFYEALLKWSPHIVVADESHMLKNPSSVRAKKIYPLASSAQRRFLMTGTPFPNSLLDIYGQYKFMDPSLFGPNYFRFRLNYFYDKNAGMPSYCHFPDWQPRPEADKKIGRILAATSLQAKKCDVLDLPPLMEVRVPVEMSPAQDKAYRQMEKFFVAEVGDTVLTAEFAMTKSLRLRQLLAGYASQDVETEAKWFPDLPRMKALTDILDSLGGAKVIIWTVFQPTYGVIAKECERMGLAYKFLTGEQSAKEKQESIESFSKGSTQVLISNPAAGGTGVDGLQASAYSIYYTRGYNRVEFEQSQARNYRGGSEQHQKVTHYHLISEGTLDEAIAEALLLKKSVSEAVLSWARNMNKPLANGKSKQYVLYNQGETNVTNDG